MELVGGTVAKEFPGFGTFMGVIESLDPSTGYFLVKYEDGDSEELDFEEISEILTAKRRRVGEVGEVGGIEIENLSLDVLAKENSSSDGYEAVQISASANFEELGISDQSRTKKQKLSTETPLRRSYRMTNAKASAVVTPQSSASNMNVMKSETASDVTKQIGLGTEEVQLPPSSTDLDIEGLSALDLFSVYTCLRSFSRLLFLSPFSLEALVAALRCRFANPLIDAVHNSILQALKLHLEFLSQEGSKPADDCLRNLNWEHLDLATWPVYAVEYLLVYKPGLSPNLKLRDLKLWDLEYYKHPPHVKLEILRCLCDDVIEVECIRRELTRRISEQELDTDGIQNSCNLRQMKEKPSSVDLSEENVDGNSDECSLCGMEGNLICCDGCPAAFHARCVGVMERLLPEGEWYCPECMVAISDSLVKLSRPSQGAKVLGIDPHGRIYFGCCDCILVSDSFGEDSSHHYYSRTDIQAVIETMKSFNVSYGSVANAIHKYMECGQDVFSSKGHLSSGVCDEKGTSDYQICAQSMPSRMLSEKLTSPEHSDLLQANPLTSHQASLPYSEQFDRAHVRDSLHVSEQSGSHCSAEHASPCTGGFSSDPANLVFEQEKHMPMRTWGLPLPMNGQKKSRPPIVQSDPSTYVNHYSFARVASSIADELKLKSPDHSNSDAKKPEDISAAQQKVIRKWCNKFGWYQQKTSVDMQKEKCGWCYVCRSSTSEDCIFTIADMNHVEVPKKIGVGRRSEKNKRSYIFSAMHHILSLEERICALLSGPWKDPRYSRTWRNALSKASDVVSLKHLLLTFESNLRRVVCSAEWLKSVDSAHSVGSACHRVVIENNNTYNGSNRRHVKKSSSREVDFAAQAATTDLYWWRGGRLSKQMFQWKRLPKSLALKCGRQAGCRKLPGIFYPDGPDSAKRSKCISWRASVEMCRSVAQLIYHVKDFDSHIRWSELSSTQLSPMLSHESKKVARLFKKVIIRRKCVEGTNIKYLLDFGKRENIPPVVIRYGVMMDEPSTERKKYWVGESHVPLHILKGFEERKLQRSMKKLTSMPYKKESKADMKKLKDPRGLPYLFSRHQYLEKLLCEHCNEDVLVREAVNCQFCKGYFHRKHFKVPKGATNANYTCSKCKDKMPKKVKARGKSKSQGAKVVSKVIALRKVSKRVRMSERQAAIMKAKKKGRPKKGKKKGQKKATKQNKERHGLENTRFQVNAIKYTTRRSNAGVSWHKRKRTEMEYPYWLNGLRWARKADDDHDKCFRETKVLMPFQHQENLLMRHVCSLCDKEYNSDVIFIGCENCEDWFHGATFGLTLVNIETLIGFRCYKCLMRSMPVCPFSEGSEVVKLPETCVISEVVDDIKDQQQDNAHERCSVDPDTDSWGKEQRPSGASHKGETISLLGSFAGSPSSQAVEADGIDANKNGIPNLQEGCSIASLTDFLVGKQKEGGAYIKEGTTSLLKCESTDGSTAVKALEIDVSDALSSENKN